MGYGLFDGGDDYIPYSAQSSSIDVQVKKNIIEEEEDEIDMDMGFSLFDDGGYSPCPVQSSSIDVHVKKTIIEDDTDIFSVWQRLKVYIRANKYEWFDDGFEEIIEKILEANNSDDFNKHIENSKKINPDLYKLYELLERYGINSLGL